VRARDENNVAVRRFGWDPERVALALDDERWHIDGVKLGQASLLRLPGRVDWEREAENSDCANLVRGAAGDPRAGGAAADDQRQAREELRDDREPGLVQLTSRCGAPSASDSVWLLDERDAEASLVRGLRCPDEVRRIDPATGPVPEHDRSARRVDLA
jgi:hypothetical protein